MPLSVADGIGKWIDDFKTSKSPQFQGKSSEQRRDMAIAAYMSAKRGDRNESVEENVSAPQTAAHRRAMMGIPKKKKDEPPFTPDPPKPGAKNSDGSNTSPMSRARQLARQARDRNKTKDEAYRPPTQAEIDADKKKDAKRTKSGDAKVYTKSKQYANYMGGLKTESVELDESVAKAYEIMKPTKSMNHGIEAIKKTMKVDHGTATRLARQVMDKVKKGEFKESVQEIFKSYSSMPGKRQIGRASDEPSYIPKYTALGNKRSKAAYKGTKNKVPTKQDEEVQIDELKKSTLGSYVKKASQDAGAKAYSAAQKAMSNPDQSGKDYVKSVKRQKGIAKATDRLTNEAGTPERLAMIRKAGEKINKEKKKAERDAKRAMAKDKDMMGEAKSFDQKFKDHLKFATSKSPAVQAYMKKRKADRDAAHAKQDPAAVKKNYGPAVIPPGTAYNKASKRGMKPTDAASAVSTAFKNRAKGGKLPN